MTTRTKAVLASVGAAVLLGAGVVVFLAVGGDSDVIPFLGGTREPVICPLTGEQSAKEGAAGRTAVAVKVENISVARPQAGLNEADIVYEEPVEGGITRFVAVYQCDAADRVGPVRSARFVDPDLLAQFGAPVFAYSGGISQVVNRVGTAGIQDMSQDRAPDLYVEDPNRSAPHNLFVTTKSVLEQAERRRAAPEALFEYEEEAPARQGSKRARQISLDFSPEADVSWQYRRRAGEYLRSHGETLHTLEDGQQVSAANIVVMVVQLRDTGIVDAAGNPSPEVVAVGSGKAFVFRNGRVIEGTWERPSEGEVTRILDRDGDVIPLAPGRTWVELFPNDLTVEFS